MCEIEDKQREDGNSAPLARRPTHMRTHASISRTWKPLNAGTSCVWSPLLRVQREVAFPRMYITNDSLLACWSHGACV